MHLDWQSLIVGVIAVIVGWLAKALKSNGTP